MSRPITLTDEVIASLVEDFKKELATKRLFDGKLNYQAKLKGETEDKVNVIFSNLAFTKMLSLVMNFDDEVAWHGTVERDGSNFYVKDIMVYPQEVTGATVNTDQGEYTEWLYTFDDETFNSIRFQGHSHVNMSVSPSSTDLTHQESILTQLLPNDFYIFLIMNKKMQMFVRVFDLATNTMYEEGDINLYLGNEQFDMSAFNAEAKKMVKKKTYSKKTESKKGKSTSYYYYDNFVDMEDYYESKKQGYEW